VGGPYPRAYRLRSWASRQIVAATVTDVAVARRFNQVVSMRAHPNSLITPGVILGALRANRRARSAAQTAH
ncbi:FAD-dependent oxidoreductase, partial [Micromonospora azadirachtae]